MASVFAVICHFTGCCDCGGDGSHIVAICTDMVTAKKFKKSHENEQDVHFPPDYGPHYGHSYYVDIEEVELDTSMINSNGFW